MATTDNVTAKDRERFAHARTRGEARSQDPSAVVDARYDPERDTVDLTFRSGGSMTIPRQIVPGLERAPESALAAITVSEAGDALSWRSLDVDVYVPGLVERAFGTRLFAAATGRRGGRRRSKAKAAAAKANGARGGRPHKRDHRRASGIRNCSAIYQCDTVALVPRLVVTREHGLSSTQLISSPWTVVRMPPLAPRGR